MLEYLERKLEPTARVIEGERNEFILSDGEPDRMGDVIEPDGWQIGKFNPIALFNHQRDNIVGKWERVRVEAKALKGSLKLAEPGTSAVVDMARALFDQGLLDTVSVGFRPIEREPIDAKDPFGPQRFKKAELIEASLVSIPANPRARRIAKQFLPDDQYRRLCLKSGVDDADQKQPGKSARTTPSARKDISMEGLSLGKKIEATEQALVNLKDQLSNIGVELAKTDEATEEQQTAVEALTAEIQAKEKSLAMLRNVEANLKTKAVQVRADRPDPAKGDDIIVPKEWTEKTKQRPFDLLTLALAGDFVSKCIYRETGQIVPMQQILAERSKTDPRLVMAVADRIIEKAAVNPAFTSVAGWAQELIQTVNADFIDVLATQSIYGALSQAGQRFTFGRNGQIKIPVRSASPTLNGSFVLEGNAIPVRRAGLTSVTLTPKKMAVISTFSREMDLHSIPAIQAIIRSAIVNDTSNAIDAVLVGTSASSTTAPAGLRATENNIVTNTASTATASYDKMIADLKGLINAIAVNGGNPDRVVIIMNPSQALSMQWVTIATGEFPFGTVTTGSEVRGIRVIVSRNIAAGSLIAVDASLFASVTDDNPQFDVSDQAAIHEEDTSPAAITGNPTAGHATAIADVAAPVRSLWQTYSAAIRMILPMNWAMLRNGGGAGLGFVSYVTGVTW